MPVDVCSLNRKTLVAVHLCVCLTMFSASASAVSHVIHISIDGLRGDLLESNLNASPLVYPNFKRFIDEGATTFNARTDYTYTNTLPNHTSMLTGRPVEQPSGATNTTHHGFTSNGIPSASATLHNSGNPNLSYVASTFDVAHDNGLSTALYASKDKFSIYEQSYAATTGALDGTGSDNGRDKIDAHLITEEFIEVNNSLLSLTHTSYLSDMAASEYNYSFLHYSLPDSAGHSAGWESEAWNKSVEDIDDYLGDIFDLIETHASLTDDTIIMLTADHGGTGVGHGIPTTPANYTIPVLLWGAGVAPSADLYALNPTSRLDPGTGRPSYSALVQPIRNGGTGNLALSLLGLGPIDGSTINASHDLVVASAFAADFDANQAVDSKDLSIWQAGYAATTGATVASGDATRDGSVDGSDFLVWQREHGSGLVGTLTVIPEPNSEILVLPGVACLLLQSRGKKGTQLGQKGQFSRLDKPTIVCDTGVDLSVPGKFNSRIASFEWIAGIDQLLAAQAKCIRVNRSIIESQQSVINVNIAADGKQPTVSNSHLRVGAERKSTSSDSTQRDGIGCDD